jgi:putative transposase
MVNQFISIQTQEDSMDEKQREEVALFRFGVISDLVCTRHAPGEIAAHIQEKSRQCWQIPNSGRTRISQSTIRRWVRLYENSDRQLRSLYPATRRDHGRSRRVVTNKVDRRRYEAEYPNDIWQSDVMHGPKIIVNGRKRKAYLIAFLDDHSRLLPYAEFYLSEQLISWLDAFRQALLFRGVPRKLYVDNGAAFRSRHLERICGSLGIALIHTPPYTPQGRGKIERFFRTVRSQFLSCFIGGTLEDLNGQSPLTRFGRHVEMIRKPPADLEDHFRKEVRRRVTKDRTVSIDSRLYEAPTRFIGEQLSLLYHEHRPEKVEIIFQGKSYGMLVPLDMQVNTKVKRDRPVQGELPFGEMLS